MLAPDVELEELELLEALEEELELEELDAELELEEELLLVP